MLGLLLARLRLLTSQKFLYRTLGSAVILGLLGTPVSVSFAQEEKPLIVPGGNRPQQNKKPKKGKDPRALAVLQFNKGGKATLVPVAILIEGRFYDASAYKADPVPMALESGTVYEGEQGGDPQGLFTVSGALHGTGLGSTHAWLGSGTFLPQGSESPKTGHKAENRPVGMDDSGDEPPRLTRKEAKTSTSPASTSTPDSSNPGSSPSGGDKPGPTKGDQGQPPSTPPSSDKAPGTENKADSKQSSGDYYRPTLRRGKPTEAAPADDDGKTKTAARIDAKTGAAMTNSAKVEGERVMAAISDAGGPEPQSYKFFWKTGEEEERRAQIATLAGNEVRKYVAERTKGVIAAKPVPKTGVSLKRAVAKQASPVLENAQFRAFDVWLTNQPVMIFSAEAHIDPVRPSGQSSSGQTASGQTSAESYSVTVVARTDIYGNLVKVHSAVTDKFHLDVTPRLELIDAVDADGDGRGELLFRETSDTGGGYVIYRATADKLWKVFDSLNAE